MAIPTIPQLNIDSLKYDAARGTSNFFGSETFGNFETTNDSIYGSDVQTFREIYNKHNSIAHTTRFEVDFSGISNLGLRKRNDQSFGTNDFFEMGYFVKEVTMPSRKINTFGYDLFRHETNFPKGYNNDDLVINFVMPGDYFIKDIFDAWLRKIIPPESYLMQYADTYKINLTVNALDNQDKIKYKVYLTEVFPTSVPAFAYSQETAQAQTLQVNFAFGNLIFDEAKR